MIRHILFDLDNTLYPPQAGLMAAIDRRIARYFARELGLRLPQAQQLQAEYCWQYGSCTEGVLRDPAPLSISPDHRQRGRGRLPAERDDSRYFDWAQYKPGGARRPGFSIGQGVGAEPGVWERERR